MKHFQILQTTTQIDGFVFGKTSFYEESPYLVKCLWTSVKRPCYDVSLTYSFDITFGSQLFK